MKNKLSGLVDASSLRAFAMIAVLAVIWGYFHWATGQIFLTPRNLSNLMTQMSVTGIIAVGMLMLIVSANIDLSVGSVLGLAGGIAAYTLTNLGYPIPVAIGLALLAGIAIGVFQGVLTAKAGIPAFIVTLGGLLAWRGAVKWQLGGNTVPIADDTFKMIGQGNIPGWVGWVLAISAVIVSIAMAMRSMRQARAFGLSSEESETQISVTIGGLVIAILGLVSFALPWISVTVLSIDLFQVSGYTFASGLTIGGVPVGGSPVFWLFPISMLAIVLTTSAYLLNDKSRPFALYSLVGGGSLSTLLLTYLLVGEKGYAITYQAGLYLAFLCSLFSLALGLVGLLSMKDSGQTYPGIPFSLLSKLLIPVGGILAFIFVMNSYQGVPVPVLIFVGVALIGSFLMSSTTFGRYLYAIGGNAEAARLSGINNSRNVIVVYGILGALTGIAALIYTARVGSAAPDAGTLKELDAIAACVIGGASLMGGRGTVFGACLGALIMASLDNGMSLLNVRDFMQDIIKGSILVAAVGLDMMGKKQG